VIEAVKNALPLRAYLAEHGIEGRGKRYRCIGRDHEDLHPSGWIYPGRDGFERLRCGGCGLDVDVVGAAMELNGLDFKGALKLLAARAGLSRQTPADTRAAAQARRERERHETAYKAWKRKKVDSMSALLRRYRQKAAQGFTEEELDAWAPLIQVIPEIEYEYESIFCVRDDSGRRRLFEEDTREPHVNAA